jgi:hypothetical protein
MALAVAANAFGAVMIVMALVPLLVVWGDRRAIGGVAAVGAAAYLAICAWVPPSLLLAMRANAQLHPGEGHNWTGNSVLALGIAVAGFALLWLVLRRAGASSVLRFAVLFAWVTTSVPLLWDRWRLYYLPQPGRYKVEAELALALLFVFGARALLSRAPKALTVGVAVAALALGTHAVIQHRRFEKGLIRPIDVTKTIEYRAAKWADANRHGRLFAPGSIGQWLNAFTDREQSSGGSYSTSYSRVQQTAYWGIYPLPRDRAETAILWWKAFGVGQVIVPGKASPAFGDPGLLEGRLEVLWLEDDTTAYRVPLRSASLAHVVPHDALVRRTPAAVDDTAELARYVDALDRAGPASFRWTGANSATIEGDVPRGSAVSIQVNWHRGWKAEAGGRRVALHRDGLGLMWAEPQCGGPCTLSLEYDGGVELMVCRAMSLLAIAGAICMPLLPFRKRGNGRPQQGAVD